MTSRSIVHSQASMPRLLAILLMLTLIGCGSQPQIGDDDASFKEIDALYTAVTSKRKDLLDECSKRIKKLTDDEKMSPEAFKKVSSIIDEATAGDWMSAAQRLHDFMRAQRR